MEKIVTTKYIAFDETEFDTEEECLDYEKSFFDAMKGIHCFDNEGKELDNTIENMAITNYIQVDNDGAFDVLRRVESEYGYSLPFDVDRDRLAKPRFPARFVYIYGRYNRRTGDDEGWFDANSIIEQAEEIKRVFGIGE